MFQKSRLKIKSLIIVALLIFGGICLTTYLLPFHTTTPAIQKYVFEDGNAYLVLKDSNVFEFNYSLWSSTIPTGEYEIIGDQIHCYDNSEYKLIYVFDIKDDTLSFNAKLSSKLPGFSNVEDSSIFKIQIE